MIAALGLAVALWAPPTTPLKASDLAKRCQPAPASARIIMDLDGAPLEDVAKLAACLDGKNLLMPGKLPGGSVGMYAPEPVRPVAARAAAEAILLAHEFTLIRRGAFLRVEVAKQAQASPAPVRGVGEAVPNRPRMFAALVQPRHVDADSLVKSLDPFKGKHGTLTAHAPSGLVVVVDSGEHHRKLLALAKRFDVPGTRSDIRLYTLRHADADTTAGQIRDLFGDADAAPKVVVDTRMNRLLVRATGDGHRQVTTLLEALDVGQGPAGSVHVLRIDHGDAASLADVLQGLSRTP
jgi:general secretion pathway protein D